MPPKFIDKPHEKELWKEPWKVNPGSAANRDFKQKLLRHGFLSPNFRVAETASKADGCGCPTGPPVGADLARAQYHAFRLERVRHALGDRPMTPLSWYRNECHNGCVNGADQSQHLEGWATDWGSDTRARLGGPRFDQAMRDEFKTGGIGYQDAGARSGVRHVDNGPAREWDY